MADRTVYDFGRLIQGAKAPCEFRLRNTAGVSVAITDVINSCDCADLDLSSRVIEPGGEALLAVNWEVGSRRGRTESQLVLVSARVAGERPAPEAPLPVEPHRQYLELTLTADVEPDFDYEPARLEFRAGEAATQVVRFTPRRVADVRLLAVRPAHRAFSARVLTDHFAVEVSFDPSLWTEGDLSELVVLTSCPGESSCRIFIDIDAIGTAHAASASAQ